MGMRAVQERLASWVLRRLAFSEICEDFWEQVPCGRLNNRRGREGMAYENTLKRKGIQRLPGAVGEDSGC